jgi:uncharacterized protein YjbI with pentapeptide repeats
MIEHPPRSPESVPFVNATDFHAFAQSWRLVPHQDSQIVAVKASFRIVNGAAATPLPQDEQVLPIGETPFEEMPTDSIAYPSDLAYFKPRCDVLMSGHAYPPANNDPLRRVELRLGRTFALALAAIGPRVWEATGPSRPAPFVKIPLRPEVAFGGPGFDANPVGRGFRANIGDPLPSLERPNQLIQSMGDRPDPIFTTPIAAGWEPRASKVGTYKGDWLATYAPYFPPDFDWSHFNAAPPELQIESVRGDESFVLAGVRPNDETIQGTLPGLRVRVLAQPKGALDRLIELPMKIDTVYFEPDEMRLILVWRGAIASADAYGGDLAGFFVTSEPLGVSASDAEIAALYRKKLDEEHGPPIVEQDEPETFEDDATAEFAHSARSRPVGVTAQMARALKIPAHMATVHDPNAPPPRPMPPPPAAAPSLAKTELAALIAGAGSLAEIDFARCDLTSADLRGRDLRGAQLMECKLDGALLDGADLSFAVLSDAQANGASFANARLDGADLTGAELEAAQFAGASLREAILDGIEAPRARFQRAKLDGAFVTEAELSGANFDGADLSRADLTGANIEGATFRAATMNDTSMYDVRAKGIVADDAQMSTFRADGIDLSAASLQRVKAPDSSLRAADLRGANFTQSVFTNSIFVGTKLDAAIFSQVEAVKARFRHAQCAGASFIKANLMQADFENANLDGADLRGANLYEANTFNTKMANVKLEHAIVR